MSPTNSAERAAVAQGEGSAAQSAGAVSEAADSPLAGHAPRPTASPAIHTVGLSKRFGDTIAVRSLSMTVERGEVFGFLGPERRGQDHGGEAAARARAPDRRVRRWCSARRWGIVETRRQIGYLPELFRFQAWLTAREVLRLHCRLLALPKAAWDAGGSRRRSRRSGCSNEATTGWAPSRRACSSGSVSAWRCSANPSLVVLDEPTSALDPVGRHDVREIIRGLRDRGATVFLNTHLLEEAEHVCDRVAVIDKGRTIATGTLAELLGRHSRVSGSR